MASWTMKLHPGVCSYGNYDAYASSRQIDPLNVSVPQKRKKCGT